MTFVTRLRLLTGVLGVAAASAVVGTTVFGEVRSGTGGAKSPAAAPRADAAQVDDLARTKFTDTPTVVYKPKAGPTVFAWQVKPALADAPARPRDVVVMIDTSASQAGVPLTRARAILAAVAKAAGPDDRIDIWTANINAPGATRSLTQGFHPAASEAVRTAVAKLADSEYGAGAVDLKNALTNAARQFEGHAGRQQVLLFLGDGESAASANPVTEAVRVELGHKLADADVQFFAVPLGTKVHPQNLHGLSALTGGAVVRVTDDLSTVVGKDQAGAKLQAAFDVPVLKVDKAAFGPEVGDVFPSRLPPLRADRATLVVGTLKAEAPSVTAKIDGRVGGNRVAVELAERLTESKPAHSFLAAMLDQWRTAPTTDAPAVLAADRSLAMASTQFGLFRDEFMAQAVWAINADKYDHADKLFQAALKIDPESEEAAAGVRVVHKIRTGETSKDKIKAQLAGGKPQRLQDAAQDPVPGAVAPAPGAPVPVPGNAGPDPAIERARAAQAVQEQEFRVLVDETLRRARQLRDVDPDAAYTDLKRQRDTVLANDALSLFARRKLVGELEDGMRYIQTQGAEIKRRLDAERERISAVRQRLTEFARQESVERQTQARIDQFRQLMKRARFEEAYQEAQVMIAERVDRGQNIPVEAYGSYRIGQSAYHLRELRELKRIRENNFLLSMMQTEKSFIPYPDEPPVHFPPARVWQELTARRTANNTNLTFGANAPKSLLDLQDTLENKTVNIQTPLMGMKLKALLDTLRETYKIPFFVREDLFRAALGGEDVNEKAFRIASQLNGVKLGSFLDVVLLDIDASYIVRPEYIEIVPKDFRLTEKQFRAFEVGDLVLAIPQSVSQQALAQNLALFGAQVSTAGAALGAANFLGGAIGNGQFGGGGGGLGGQIGQLGGGQGGAQFQGGAVNALNQVGVQNNLGVGGGVFGIGGGQLGQFGNLGGQFGIQGNSQQDILMNLIRTVVAYREWDTSSVGAIPSAQPTDEDTSGPIVPPDQLNSLGYYPAALALVVRGSTRYHPNQSFKLKGAAAIAGGGPGLDRGGKFAANDPAKPNPAAAKAVAKDLLTKAGKDPQKIWNEAFDRAVTDPNLLVQAADALFEMKEYGHAAEALKAGIRKGRTSSGWAFEALGIALQQSQAAPGEVERVAMSGVDLEPTDAKAYLKAAKSESDLGQHVQAVAYCQRAAALEPNSPASYANALVYADCASDVQADVVHWATANLLRRDWQNDGVDYHKETRYRAATIAKKLAATGKMADAAKLEAALAETAQRDLVVELLYQGSADLDLEVGEPTGSVASAVHPRTTGGGVLKCDVLEQKDNDRSEVYTAARAFSGTYTLSVKTALGRPTGNKALVKVTRFQGTPNEAVEVHSVDLGNPKPVTVSLENGSRTELATVPVEDGTAARNASTGAGVTAAPTGISAGVGAGSANLLSSPAATRTAKAMPLVNETLESSLPGISPALPGVRVAAVVSPDRTKMTMTATPVFLGKIGDIPLPKVALLPGSEAE